CQGVFVDMIRRGLIVKLAEVDQLSDDAWTGFFSEIVKNWLIDKTRKRKLTFVEIGEREIVDNNVLGPEMGLIAAQFLTTLNKRQNAVLKGLCEGKTLEEIGVEINTGKSMAGNEKETILKKITEASGTNSRTKQRLLAAICRKIHDNA